MIGLIFIAVGIAYLAIVIGATYFAYSFAKKRGYGTGKRSFFAVLGFLIITLPIFWDVIPTYIAYNYYCEREAGLTIFKSADQWKAENSDAAKTLQPLIKTVPKVNIDANTTRQVVNERFVVESFYGFVFLAVRKFEKKLIDFKTNEVLVSSRSFHAAYLANNFSPYEGVKGLQAIKFWIRKPTCRASSKGFDTIVEQFKSIGSE